MIDDQITAALASCLADPRPEDRDYDGFRADTFSWVVADLAGLARRAEFPFTQTGFYRRDQWIGAAERIAADLNDKPIGGPMLALSRLGESEIKPGGVRAALLRIGADIDRPGVGEGWRCRLLAIGLCWRAMWGARVPTIDIELAARIAQIAGQPNTPDRPPPRGPLVADELAERIVAHGVEYAAQKQNTKRSGPPSGSLFG